jgi:hypothetical protein
MFCFSSAPLDTACSRLGMLCRRWKPWLGRWKLRQVSKEVHRSRLAIFCRGRPHPVLLSRRNLDLLLFQDLVCFPRTARFRAPSIPAAGPPKTQLRLHLPLSQVLIHLQFLTPHHSLVTTVSTSCLEQPYYQLESCNVEYLTYSCAARPWLSISQVSYLL